MSEVEKPVPTPVAQTEPKKKLRLKTVAAKPIKKYIWLAGHVVTVPLSLIYFAYYIQFKSHYLFPRLCYRFALFGVWAAYSMTIATQFSQRAMPSYFALLSTQNFQYLSLSFIWQFNRNSLFKLLPYFLISVLQLSLHFNIKPVLKLDKVFKVVIVYNELFLFVLLIFDTILLRGTSGYALVMFGLFYWLRLLHNESTRKLLYNVLVKLDGPLSKSKNDRIRSQWQKIKVILNSDQKTLQSEYS
ncbi:unnamed protein product [Kuraishia capsulata CBS 1993]|uniref:Uncharacterized protein n=1 Tax=Kuraishia capsulata CBS 1993 TaxID=1382522 RepID=W6MPF9_9ASCO|nr:uncharacterized protein KUCA_T00002969001 [Kuraishia capsulata CBS 1993]CDK26992.1 unnamed protein product [Kuraishia capsulata CBS 1993]